MKKLGYGKGYQYAHNFPEVKTNQTHFPREIGEKKYYFPEKDKKANRKKGEPGKS